MTETANAEEAPEMVKSVAKAIYFSKVESARRELDNIDFDLSDFPDVFLKLSQEGETAQVLIFGSYLEDRITGLIRTKMKHLSSKEDENNLFGPHGPLSSFSARVLLSYQLGWISTETKNKLDAFRKIRNHFAHKAYQARLSDPEIINFLNKLDYNPERMLDVIAGAVENQRDISVITQQELTPEKRYLCNFAYLAEHVFKDLLVLPIALSYNVDPHSLSGGYEQSPEAIKKLYRLLATALMSIIIRQPIANTPPDATKCK